MAKFSASGDTATRTEDRVGVQAKAGRQTAEAGVSTSLSNGLGLRE